MFIFSILVIIVIVVLVLITINNSNQKRNSYSPSTYSEHASSSSNRPRISAEVSEDFYDSVKKYCQNNSMTISALIRKAVSSYISADSEPPSIIFSKPSSSISSAQKPPYIREDGSWKCPKCGTINAAYVGSCSCGQNKEV